MALLMLILTAAFALLGLVPCAGGATAVAALFGAMVGVLTIGVRVWNCP
jgi:hypothetical protein